MSRMAQASDDVLCNAVDGCISFSPTWNQALGQVSLESCGLQGVSPTRSNTYSNSKAVANT